MQLLSLRETFRAGSWKSAIDRLYGWLRFGGRSECSRWLELFVLLLNSFWSADLPSSPCTLTELTDEVRPLIGCDQLRNWWNSNRPMRRRQRWPEKRLGVNELSKRVIFVISNQICESLTFLRRIYTSCLSMSSSSTWMQSSASYSSIYFELWIGDHE